MRLRMEAIKSTALLHSYSTSPMVLALAIVLDLALPLYGVRNCVWLYMVLAIAIVLDLALPLYGVSNCVWLAVSCFRGAKVHGAEGGAN